MWWDAITFSASAIEGCDDLVRDKLNWESHKVAVFLRDAGAAAPERVAGLPFSLLVRKPWNRIRLEDVGGVRVPSGTPINLLR